MRHGSAAALGSLELTANGTTVRIEHGRHRSLSLEDEWAEVVENLQRKLARVDSKDSSHLAPFLAPFPRIGIVRSTTGFKGVQAGSTVGFWSMILMRK